MLITIYILVLIILIVYLYIFLSMTNDSIQIMKNMTKPSKATESILFYPSINQN